jgi:hypothetical protein
MSIKLNISTVQDLVATKGGLLISNEYRNNYQKLDIVCAVGHAFQMIWSNLRKGKWCRECHNLVRSKGQRIGIDAARVIIEARGGKLLSNEYINNKTGLEILCACGNVFFNCIDKIKNRGQWCSVCRGGIRYPVEFVNNEISKRGGQLLSGYNNSVTRLDVKCNKCKETWHPTFHDIMASQWCPGCSRWKSQNELKDILESILTVEAKSNFKGFSWLLNTVTRRRQEFDVYVPQFKLAVEYDGEQHFRPVCFGGMSLSKAKSAFKRRRILDKRKNRLVKKHREDVQHFIRIRYDEPLTKEHITTRLVEAGVIIAEEARNEANEGHMRESL